MTNSSQNSFVDADYEDPFRPPTGSRPIKCEHCGETYESKEMFWDSEYEIWVCRNWPKCSGAGYGVDIHDVANPSSKGESPT
ncbi:MAG: hypothetical protein GXP26_02525 [Planctomycetes bacterium]|nr:hypothetical protein [Planctomycetota bacterium]